MCVGMLVPSLSFPLCCSFSPLYFFHLKSLLSKITSFLTQTPKHSTAILLTNSSFHILCLDNAVKYNQFVRSYTRVCVCVCVCVYTGGGGADGQHRLVLVWGLDQCRVIITDPLLCFHDPLSVGFDL